MQLEQLMQQAKTIAHVLDFLKVPIPSMATIYAWFSGFDVLGVTEAAQEVGILAIIILNAWWVYKKIKMQMMENRWAKQDRYDEQTE